MKTDDLHNTEPPLQTINECLRVQPESCPVHSNGKPDVLSTINRIDVRFAPNLQIQLQIKYVMKTTSSSSPTLFAELMLHPEKLEAALRAAKKENDAFAASRKFGRDGATNAWQNAVFEIEDGRKSSNEGFTETVHQPAKVMKRKILLLAGLALASLTMIGCGHRSEDSTPASNDSAGDQPMPGAAGSNNVITSPGVTWNNTNNPAPTNWPGTNNPGATNQ